MKEMKVRIEFTEEVLGTASANKEIHEQYIASKAPDAKSIEEEVAAIGVEEVVEKAMTVFPRTADGTPMFWDYQIKGFFKDTCGALKKVSGTDSSKIKAHKKEIDGLIFIKEREIPIHFDGNTGNCQRPLRGQTPQGEKITLANSETVPAGSWVEFTIMCMVDADMKMVAEWLDYGKYRGIGQWRNSGKGRFVWKMATE